MNSWSASALILLEKDGQWYSIKLELEVGGSQVIAHIYGIVLKHVVNFV